MSHNKEAGLKRTCRNRLNITRSLKRSFKRQTYKLSQRIGVSTSDGAQAVIWAAISEPRSS
ncbi:hypothetical protein [Paraburkholderia xenovorans]|uniref:hypothetical protein n=1 Tax=Paraburkholderia xenovorans TaxID=36873 RepID=UPI0038BA0B7E